MNEWLRGPWQAFLRSFDPEYVRPRLWQVRAGSWGAGSAVSFGLVGYVPAFARASGLAIPALCICIAVFSAACAYLAVSHGQRGSLGALFIWAQIASQCTAFSLAAVQSREGFGLGFALLELAFVIAVPARNYALSVLLASAVSAPPALLVLWFRPPLLVGAILLGGSLLGLFLSRELGRLRTQTRAARGLELALHAIDRALDVTRRLVLEKRPAELSAFLHELRNRDAAVRMNLEFLGTRELRDAEATAAAREALCALQGESPLIGDTLEALRRHAQIQLGSLVVGDVVRSLLESHAGLPELIAQKSSARFRVDGDAEYLAVVLRHLVRNARQAGASEVHFEFDTDPDGTTGRLLVRDNGAGLSPGALAELNRVELTIEPERDGLGLYVCRRYLELLRGSLRAHATIAGACFEIRMPGTAVAVSRGQESPPE